MQTAFELIPKDVIKQIMDVDAPMNEKIAFLDHYAKESKMKKAKSDFGHFSELVMKDEKKFDRETGIGEPIELQRFHWEWASYLENEPRLVVFSPRETGKSSLFSVSYPLWRLGLDPNLRIAIISAASHQSKRILQSIKQYVMVDPDLKKLFPNLRPQMDEMNVKKPKKWASEQILIERQLASKDASVVCYGCGSKSILGSRFDLVILDDVLGPHNTSSKTEMDKVIEWYSNVLEKCLVEGGQIVCIGTAWNSSDLMHYLEKKDGWTCIKYSFDEEDKLDNYHWVDWPERHSKDKLDREKANDIVSYNRNRRCRTSSAEERMFENDFKQVCIRDYDIEMLKKSCNIFMGVDLSTKKRKGTAICVVGVLHGKQYVLDVSVGAWNVKEKISAIRSYAEIYNPELIFVENNALQDDVVDAIKADGRGELPIKSYTTGAAKHSKLERLALEMSNDRWRFCYPSNIQDVIDGKRLDDSSWGRFMQEVKMYPDFPSNDMLMSWLFAAEAAKGREKKDIQFRVFNYQSSDEDDLLNLMESRPRATFSDYRIGNSVSYNGSYQVDLSHQEIVGYIQANMKPSDDPNDFVADFDADKFLEVFNDMKYYCDSVNGELS